MEIWHAVALSVIEGFTEFLPISSTAHLVLAGKLMGLGSHPFTKTFEIAVQSGAILAVLTLYWRRFLDWQVFKRLIIAFIPTGIIGLVFYKIIKGDFFENVVLILIMLALGGAFLIFFEKYFKPRTKINDFRTLGVAPLILIGVFQALAVVPGVSRAAATIIGGLILGFKREAIVEFSFLLAVPTMLGATGYDLLKNYSSFSTGEFTLLGLGLITSFVMALLSIKFLLKYIKTHSFVGFGIYRIVFALAIGLLIFSSW